MTARKPVAVCTIVVAAALLLAAVMVILTVWIAAHSAGTSPGGCAVPGEDTLSGRGKSLPAACTITPHADNAVPAELQTVTSLDLVLTRPSDRDLVPYSRRGFSRETEAAIAWWMFPGFDNENRQYRSYLRAPAGGIAAFPPDERTFFDHITVNLDAAESLSTASSDLLLYRGITPGVASIILNSSSWDEAPFASTSYDITVTLEPYATRDAGGYQNVLVIPVHAGDHIIYLSEEQREFLLPRGTGWDVVAVKNVEHMNVTAGFPLHNRTEYIARFTGVRLIYLEPRPCQ